MGDTWEVFGMHNSVLGGLLGSGMTCMKLHGSMVYTPIVYCESPVNEG
jgi:hypothetical protein